MKTRRGDTRHAYAVRGEVTKQLCVLALVAVLGIWQHHFVIQAASADVYLFALLFGAGLFGMYNAVKGTHRLNNEFVALQAMKESYEDALWLQSAPEEALTAQFRRTQSRAIVYHMPSVLATAHNLIVEEVQRNGLLRISTTTMQVLVADLESKLDDRQGMTHYLGALMVLLGLLGTFIGLMHTLESVGGILGSLDLSGSAGAGAIAGLIESLKKPLDGMSTGFGASLFGLIGSLLIGFLGKVDSKASFRLKHEFETWIRSTVQLEDARGIVEKPVAGRAKGAGEATEAVSFENSAHARTVLKAARLTLASTSKLAEQVGALAAAFDRDRDERARRSSAIDALVEQGERSLNNQALLDARLAEVVERLGTMHGTVRAAAGRVDAMARAQGRASASAAASILEEVRFLRDALVQNLASAGEARADGVKLRNRVDGVSRDMASGFDKLNRAAQSAVAGEVANAVAELDHLIAASRIAPRDIHNLRRLSALAEEMTGAQNAAPPRHASDPTRDERAAS